MTTSMLHPALRRLWALLALAGACCAGASPPPGDPGVRFPATLDPIAQQAYLKASNTGLGDGFGYAVAVSGDTLVVGAYNEASSATGVNGTQTDNSAFGSGAVYVFVRSGTTWTQQAYLKASNTGAGDSFGYAVAVAGDTVVVGAVAEASGALGVNGIQTDNSAFSSGAAYVFVRSGTNWTQQAYLKASNTGVNDKFGNAVAVSGDTVVVGAYLEGSSATGVNGNQSDNSAGSSGAAYVFVRHGTTWTQQAYLKASNTGADDRFGNSVSVSGDTVVIGANLEDSNAVGVDGVQADNSASNSGAAYVFVRHEMTWTQQAYLKASNTESNDHFGLAVAVSGDTVIVGAHLEDSGATGVDGPQADNSANNSGAAYVFVRRGTAWTQQAYLKASNTESNDNFGTALAVSGDTVIVGAQFEDSNATGANGNQTDNSAGSSGAAYVFARYGTNWTQEAYLKASNTGAGDRFGNAVAVSDLTAVIGAYLEDSNATGANGNQSDNSVGSSGAAFVFALPPADSAPAVTAPSSADVAVAWATLGGTITADGGADITGRGVVYSLTSANPDPLIGGSGVTQVTNSGTTGVFTVNASGLMAKSGYSFKAYAISRAGTGYSPVAAFMTIANTAPGIAFSADAVTVLEDSGLVASNAFVILSPGTAAEAGQTIRILSIDHDNPALFSAPPAIEADGTLTFTPAANANGTAIVTIIAQDDGGTENGGVDAATNTFTLTVTAVNDAPSFTLAANTVTVTEDSGPVASNAFAIFSAGPADESSQIVRFALTNDNDSLFFSPPVLDASGTLTFTPATNAYGNATVTVTARDDGGGIDTSAPQTFVIHVTMDTTPPDISCPGNLTVTATSAEGAVVSYPAAASDASGLADFVCTPLAGSTFPPGLTPVRCVATDRNGNTNSCAFTVEVLEAGPAGRVQWKFDEASGTNALDTSANGNHGWLLNGPARTNGVLGHALRFDGANDRVTAPDPASLNVTGAFTVACWVRPEKVSSSTYFVIKGNEASDRFAYALRASSAKVQYRWVNPAGTKSTYGTTANVLAAGRWTHVAVAHTPGSLPTLFINGVAVAGSLSGGSATALVGASSNAFSVGASADGKGLFRGAIDEVFLCDGALVAGQVQNLTNGLPPGPPPPAPPPVIATASLLPPGQVDAPFFQTLVATGGTPGFTWSLVSNALPSGLTFNANTGVITGTPGAATTNTFRVRVRDAAARTAEREFLLVITNLPPTPPGSFLVQWKFDEAAGVTALDSTDSGNHGALLNGPVRTNGLVGGALRFDGSDDRVAATNAISLNVTGALTLAVWARPESVSGSHYLLVKGSLSGSAYSYALRGSDAKAQYRWVSPGGTENKFATTANVLTNGQWTHLAVVHTPGSLPVFYLNGLVAPGSLSSGSATAPRVASPNPFTVGSSSDGSGLFQGALDEVVVCAGALTPAQIQGLMNGTLPAPPAPVPPPSSPPGHGGGTIPMALRLNGDRANISWSSVPGQAYRVQYKNQLDDDWLDLTGNFHAVDADSAVEDDRDGQPQRFYRVVLEP